MGESSRRPAGKPGSARAAPTGASGRPTKIIGDYELVSKVGQGGMGSVFKARQISTGRTVAFKVLPPSFATKQNLVARFKREVRILLALKHENIVEGFDAGQVGNLHYLAMEYVDGRPVTEMLAREGRLDAQRTLGIVMATARALAYAHSKGLIHRDVKPDNILLRSDGVVKLCDLGLARQQADVGFTMIGTKLGTPKYMSPEQVTGVKTIDGRTDVYSLGATAYYLLTGSVPHDAASGTMIMAAQLTGTIAPVREVLPDADPHLAAVIEHCLEKKPEDRYQTMDELVRDLRLVASGEPPRLPSGARAGPDPAAARLMKAAPAPKGLRGPSRQRAERPRSSRGLLVALLVIAALVAGGAWALFWGPLKTYGDAVRQRVGLSGRP